MKFGVQTFTVRKEQKKSIRGALLPLIDMGIGCFEIARIKFNKKNAEEIAALVRERGIKISAVQVKPKYVFKNPDGIIAFCKAVGCKNVAISMLPFGCILGNEGRFYDFVASLDGMCDLYEKEGITLAYHHHNWEYIRLSNGRTRMEELLLGSKKIKIVHDTYWTAGCGIDPSIQISRFSGRLLGIHLRDLSFRRSGLRVLHVNSAVGDGVIDFESVIRSAIEAGCEYYVIEENTRMPYSEIEKSYQRLEKIKSNLEIKE